MLGPNFNNTGRRTLDVGHKTSLRLRQKARPFLHALAVPAQVRHFSVSLCHRFDTALRPVILLLSAMFDEAIPSSVECKFSAHSANHLFTHHYLRFLSTIKSLMRCTLTSDYVYFLERPDTPINVILSELSRASSMTQLILNGSTRSAVFNGAQSDYRDVHVKSGGMESRKPATRSLCASLVRHPFFNGFASIPSCIGFHRKLGESHGMRRQPKTRTTRLIAKAYHCKGFLRTKRGRPLAWTLDAR
ncbi:hypothetical protein GY45DRAFT_208035 [Cubamyces sp. BRFM 1775]|nr:hypothetical protein GY45DRAFT_208035 [Cubamyces sp. BRFM 1775]